VVGEGQDGRASSDNDRLRTKTTCREVTHVIDSLLLCRIYFRAILT
jgi:hypothetical protein